MMTRRIARLLLAGVLLMAGIACGQPAPAPDDDRTVALWLFDEEPYAYTTLTDGSATGRADLTLMESGRLEPGRYGRALAPGQGAGFRCGYAGYAGKVTEERLREKDGTPSGLWGPTEGPVALLDALAGRQWTLEFWLRGESSPKGEGVILDLGQAFQPGFTLLISEGDVVVKNAYAGWNGRVATQPTALSDRQWHHHALVCRDDSIVSYVDGVERATSRVSPAERAPLPDPARPKDRVLDDRGFKSLDPDGRRGRRFNLALTEDRTATRRLNARIDEIRISKVARYRSAFSPPGTFSRSLLVPSARATGPSPLFKTADRGGPITFGARKHVFIDDALLDSAKGVTLTMNRPTNRTRIDFIPERSAWRPAVFDHDGGVCMMITDSYGSKTGNTHLATSTDGIHFTLERNIITDTPMYAEVFRDPNPDALPEHAYKMTGFIANRGVYLYTSPDGRRWRRSDTTMLPIRSGGSAETYFDDQRGMYVSVLRRDSSYDGQGDSRGPGQGRRCVLFESPSIFGAWPFRRLANPYFEGWPFPALTNEGENVFMPNALGQVYRTRVIKYPWAPDAYLCFIWRFPPETQARQVELGTSRDGRVWRYWGPWYIDKGERDEALSLYGLIRRGDEIWQYSDHGGAHGGREPRDYYRWTQRLDGFVSLDAGAATGVAITRPLTFSGDRLSVNVKASGAVRVALLDGDGNELPGFGLADCQPITGDDARRAVQWKSGVALSKHAGSTVRVKFDLRDAKLYAFEFSKLRE